MNLSVRTSRLLMLFMSGVSIFVTPLTGKWIDRQGIKQPIWTRSVLSVLGAVLLSLFFVHATTWGMGLILSILGISYKILNVVLQAAMLKESPAEMIGTTSGLFQTCRYFGSILSSIVLGLVFGKAITAAHMQILGIVLIFTGVGSLLMSLRFTGVLGKTERS